MYISLRCIEVVLSLHDIHDLVQGSHLVLVQPLDDGQSLNPVFGLGPLSRI
jgi:hypothetical protein